ncbi:uncharacterized protein LOC131995725 isoform X1 [Stomoxys calcitrans]|uniref:uncharacterized protein LOC131994884 isoform X1 n=1 Tax=Stomoxys calcitrans TaxID=35570 RepID=UPI0027E35C3D|nr:uncharacterized protein LOC131994884 isoform X1 [Stomoxys calcitrans]XP_059217919.1 uncharacterized protein LOC131994884 isoform X1 [Stomoxys calcitrans]XP_059220656.1 uncharacterized protein LOC131995725 isoform X1 [Stomoxys calcitrans]
MYSLVKYQKNLIILKSKDVKMSGSRTAIINHNGKNCVAFLLNKSDYKTLSFQKEKLENQKSASPFGKTTHRSWKDDEKAAALAAFGDPLLLHQLPSNSECLSAINKCPALSERTPQQLKTWIDNQRRKDIRKKRFQESKLQKQKQTKKKHIPITLTKFTYL